MVTKGKLPRFPAELWIEKALTFSKERKEDDFEAIFSLLVYGLLLFPNIDNFVNKKNVIKVFMKGHPVPTLLGNTYYSIHLRNYYGKVMITCCTPLLYKWMKTIDSYGNFPNVHLLRIKGGINYSHILAHRQFGFPMDKRPRNILLDGFFLEEGIEDKEFKEMIANTWHPSHRKEIKDWKTKEDLSPEPLVEWISSRAAELRVPYLPETSSPPIEKPVARVVSPPTMEDLQLALKKMKKSREF
ncbi:uncharacterized protein LOC131641862 [Vicia villosa]|uniref:uncharacterized protein LOC131641862 n=1 Tax=Vicia villosa TaxID=3911 RepID=UPI00273B71A1|nr:uncharacterized protein LOC131641862 [Vicia villosa]